MKSKGYGQSVGAHGDPLLARSDLMGSGPTGTSSSKLGSIVDYSRQLKLDKQEKSMHRLAVQYTPKNFQVYGRQRS